MRPLRALAIYFSVVFLGGGLLAPWLYWLAQQFADQVPYLAEQPFRRYVNRCMLVLALAGMWPLFRGFGAESPHEFGLVKPAGQWARVLGGFTLGFVSLAVIVALTLAAGVREFDDHVSSARLLKKLGEAALTAGIVSVTEELLFRGAIFGAFRKVLPWRVALVISSGIYAILHFMKRADQVGPVCWYSGLVILGDMLSGFTNLREVIPGFFNLTLAGALLALAYQRTGTLYFSIGLHAGWIFWRRANGAITNDASTDHLWFWGTTAMTDGWLACLVLAVALLVLSLTLREKVSSPTVTFANRGNRGSAA
jgi:membrane protease YdiL (CAAX protease family)